MEIRASQKINALPGYVFAELDNQVAQLRAQGADLIDFGVGDPTDPTPAAVRQTCQTAIDRHARSGYPSYTGSQHFREGAAEWTARRYGITCDPEKEISATIGSKEAIFNFPMAILDPGDIVLIPNPGYPPYARGTLFAGGRSVFLDLRQEHGFLPDFSALSPADVKRTRILWMNYPQNPTGAVMTLADWENCVDFCHRHNIILASDESYSEIYFNDPPPSPLQLSRDGVIVFQSLSKRSRMTGYRVGWVAGDARLIALFKKLKTNIDSGCPTFIQEAALAALADEQHVASQRQEYRAKLTVLLDSFRAMEWPVNEPRGTFYIWQPVPNGLSSVEFALKLLDPAIGIVTMPGNWLAESQHGYNPGEGYVRWALVPSLDRCREAANRLQTLKL